MADNAHISVTFDMTEPTQEATKTLLLIAETLAEHCKESRVVPDPQFTQAAERFGIYAANLAGAKTVEDVEDLERGIEYDMAMGGEHWMKRGRAGRGEGDDDV